ncbi:MAG: hypothetical protein HYX66_08945 [Ignavibacteria bacterium]|nr:hypothetical protein [Ignavibacteria bacterium]
MAQQYPQQASSEDFNLFAQETKDALENHGGPKSGAKFYQYERKIEHSVITLVPGVGFPSTLQFFNGNAQNTDLSTMAFPINGVAMDILGFRIDHCLKQTLTDAGLANEQQQLFESLSTLKIKYRGRSDVFTASLSDLVGWSSVVDGNDVTVDAKVQQFLMLKNPIRYGAGTILEPVLHIPNGFTVQASAAAETPIVPAGVGAAYWIKLSMLTRQFTQV